MRRRTLPRNAIALLALLSCTAAAADAPALPALPSLPQVQALMDQMFDEAIAERPASGTSRLLAETLRPGLESLTSCAPAADSAAVDCIVTSSTGIHPRPQLLRLAWVGGQWTLPDQRDVPMPAPSAEQAQALLRARFAALATQQTDAGERAAYEQAARITQVHAVRNCDLGREAAVFECTVRAGDGTHQGEQTVAFIRVDGQWQEAPTR